MKSPRRLLLLEDNPVHAEMLRRTLATEWPECDVVRVYNEASYNAALQGGSFDLIISDYLIPGFDGLSALAAARQHCPHIPFVFVSGAIQDEMAVDCLKAGATDYVLKDRPARLVPAIRRALNEAEESVRRKLAEDRLRQSEDQYRDLFENATDLIQSVTPEGTFLYVNRAWRQTLQYSELEVEELTIFDVLHPEYHERWRQWLEAGEREAGAGSREVIFRTKYGRHLYVEGNVGARYVCGKLVAARGIFRDVTEKKLTAAALKRSIRQHEGLIHSVDGIVWQAELPKLRFTFVSQQAERLLGYPARRWLEEPNFWQEHIHPEDRSQALRHCMELNQEQKYKSFEYRMLASDGRVVWLRDNVSLRAEPGEAVLLQGIMVDITRRKQAEAARFESEARLEQTNHDLLRKNQEIQNFYHTLSHELKTPLTSAREFISIVMDGLAGPLNETQTQYLGIAKDSCNQLRLCINDLLDATRLETGKLAIELKPCSLGSLIERVVLAMKRASNDKQIVLSQEVQEGLAEVPLDASRITQVLTNLLNNAIKFTPPGGGIVIKAAEAEGRPEWVEVSVTDSGLGIPKDEQEHIFDRLYQIKAGDASTDQGVGLGLYLSRELVQLHGGRIWVDSEPGKGSRFTFVLPKSRESLQSNLLVIEDDPDTLHMLRDVLVAGEYNVRTARDGKEGLAEMRRQTPDLVLLDLSMPNCSGPATLEEIRKNWESMPVIVHTGFANSELMKQASAFSPFTLLAKPCSPDQILETVRKVQRTGDTTVWKRNHGGIDKPRFN